MKAYQTPKAEIIEIEIEETISSEEGGSIESILGGSSRVIDDDD